MRKYFILFSLIIIFNNFIFPEENTNTNINKVLIDNKSPNINKGKSVSFFSIIDFWAYPFVFEPSYSSASDGLNGRVMLGLKYDKFTFGVSMFENYFSTGQHDGNMDFFGAVNIFRWTFDFFYSPVEWIDIRSGIGGSFSAFSYAYKYKYNDKRYDGGLFFLFDMKFLLPIKVIEFQLLNRLDILFGGNVVTPRYTGSGRFIVHPYFSWIGLYIEAGGETFIHRSENVEVVSGYFIWSVGIQFELDIPKMKTEFLVLNDNFKNKKNYQVNLKKSNTPNITDATDDALKKNDTYGVENKNDTYGIDDKNDAYEIVDATEDSIKKLLTAEVGDVVEFNNILFYPDDDRIMEESRPVLDEIVEILIKRKNIVIEIGGYTNSVGKFEDELELSMKRALKVALYLSGKGVEANRIKATGYGGIKGEGASEVKRKVEIKILKYK